MSYFLVIDQGNTRLKAGLFRDRRLVRKVVLDKPMTAPLRSLCGKHAISAILLSSVSTTSGTFLKDLRKIAPVTLLTSDTELPISNRYKSPKSLGSDRVAAAAGAAALFPKQNVLIIDAGTCIKYDFLHRSTGYLGGSIAPGISLRLKVLHEATARLPLLKADVAAVLTGRDTRSSMLSGCVLAAALEAEGFIQAYRKRYKDVHVVVTGGDARYLSKHLNFSIFAAPDLVLFGLNSILQHDLSQR
jgi:type III pantothenate kinase